MKFQIDRLHFNALRVAAPRDEVRYYLNGFHLHRNGRWWAESTNGHRLLRVPLERLDDGPEPESTDGLIFRFTDQKKWPDHFGETLTLNVHPVEPDSAQIAACSVTGHCKPTTKRAAERHDWHERIDGRYPDTDRIMPDGPKKDATFSALAFNPEYLADVPHELAPGGWGIRVYATNDRNSGCADVRDGGPISPLWVETFDETVRYIVMPCRM